MTFVGQTLACDIGAIAIRLQKTLHIPYLLDEQHIHFYFFLVCSLQR